MSFSRETIFEALFNLITQPITVNGNSHTSNTIDGLSSTIGLCYGQPYTGPGVPSGAYITGVNASASSLTLSAATTSSVVGGAFTVTPYAYTSRKLCLPEDLGQERRPALIQVEPEEEFTPVASGQPNTCELIVYIIIVTWAKDFSGPAISLLNPRIDALQKVLEPSPLTQWQTLGFVNGMPLVNHCWLEGKVVKVSGDLDGDGVASVPVKILVPA